MINVFPILHTHRLHLVEIQPHHATDMFRLLTDVLVKKYYLACSFDKEEDLLLVISNFKTQFYAGEGIRWGITINDSNEVIGTIGFHHLAKGHKATVLFALMPEHHSNGYATEALNEVMRYGFTQLELKRIDAEVMPGNTASENLLKKAGFAHEGLLRRWTQWDSRQHDMNMYAAFK